MDREEAARHEEYRVRMKKDIRTPWIGDPRTQAQMDARFRAWDAVGLNRERQNELPRSYGFPERSASTDGHAESGGELVSQWKEWDEQSREPPAPIPEPSWPVTGEEMEERYRAWDASGITKERQAELVRMFRFYIRPSSTDENGVVSKSQASPPSTSEGYFSQTSQRSNHQECATETKQYSQRYAIPTRSSGDIAPRSN
ncbi:hypothetical protein QBC46DRAFT_452644 [Diplogelasinospora grovesii]|uniref:Uncharacterized protein n=1 Tax=Diplogelasinospora grovesii TaxID=303347 RepID=A0AAN6S1I0_9PEZI|nr:hypothetical protein QBC46DRAFT_452644 [Diplogelasinospora grovesii]